LDAVGWDELICEENCMKIRYIYMFLSILALANIASSVSSEVFVDSNYNASSMMRGPIFQETATMSRGAVGFGSPHPEILKTQVGKSTTFALSAEKGIRNPLQLYLRNDSVLDGEGLKVDATDKALILASSTWDHWTKNNLFAPTIINDPSKAASTRDGYSVIAFADVGHTAAAYAWTYRDDAGNIIESDIVFNSNARWTTDWNTAVRGRGTYLDFQTIALHELGHSIGLRDIYSLPSPDERKRDLTAIMNVFATPRHTLGKGDIRGTNTLYGY
jgi:hypothetical protein